ncbi:hypothetical protein Cadr_000021209 [Camelus dromedarius]|uniref:Uncharacterized protein n=1 Tax=Camelus dromedarius TaxID=9838 RepID=A0A5N4CTU8_CAMDR|nr:hypothetical protein Cadr_000021209 [Camelus dromedarius]
MPDKVSTLPGWLLLELALWMSFPGPLGLVEGAEDGLADLAGHGVEDEEEEDSDQIRQYRRQMKKTKVFSGFTNQLKEVLGRLKIRKPLGTHSSLLQALARPPGPPTHLGFSKGSGSLRPFPTGRFSASSTRPSSQAGSGLAPTWPGSCPGRTHLFFPTLPPPLPPLLASLSLPLLPLLVLRLPQLHYRPPAPQAAAAKQVTPWPSPVLGQLHRAELRAPGPSHHGAYKSELSGLGRRSKSIWAHLPSLRVTPRKIADNILEEEAVPEDSKSRLGSQNMVVRPHLWTTHHSPDVSKLSDPDETAKDGTRLPKQGPKAMDSESRGWVRVGNPGAGGQGSEGRNGLGVEGGEQLSSTKESQTCRTSTAGCRNSASSRAKGPDRRRTLTSRSVGSARLSPACHAPALSSSWSQGKSAGRGGGHPCCPQAQNPAPHPACPSTHHPAPGTIKGLGDRPAQGPSPCLQSHLSAQPRAWPSLQAYLFTERVHIIQNHVLRVPDDDSELIAEGCIGGGFSDLGGLGEQDVCVPLKEPQVSLTTPATKDGTRNGLLTQAGPMRKPACREKWENDRTGMTAGNPRGTEGGAVTLCDPGGADQPLPGSRDCKSVPECETKESKAQSLGQQPLPASLGGPRFSEDPCTGCPRCACPKGGGARTHLIGCRGLMHISGEDVNPHVKGSLGAQDQAKGSCWGPTSPNSPVARGFAFPQVERRAGGTSGKTEGIPGLRLSWGFRDEPPKESRIEDRLEMPSLSLGGPGDLSEPESGVGIWGPGWKGPESEARVRSGNVMPGWRCWGKGTLGTQVQDQVGVLGFWGWQPRVAGMVEGPCFYVLRYQLDPKARHLLPVPQHLQCLGLLGDLTYHLGFPTTCNKKCVSLGSQLSSLPPLPFNRCSRLRQLLHWEGKATALRSAVGGAVAFKEVGSLGCTLDWAPGAPSILFYHLALPSGLLSREGLVPGGRTLLPTLTALARYSGAGRPQRWHSPARICEGRNASRQALYPPLQA